MSDLTSKAYKGGAVEELDRPAAISGPTGGNGGSGRGSSYRKPSGRRSSSSSTDPDAKKKAQAAPNNLSSMYTDPDGGKIPQHEKDTFAKLKEDKRKMKANDAAFQQQRVNIATQNTWQPQQQKEQSTMMALRNRMGNAAYGSGIIDLIEGMGRVDDMADSENIETYKNNMRTAYDNWYQAANDLVGDYNADLLEAQSDMADLLNQYQAGLNNINPLLGDRDNIKKAAKNARMQNGGLSEARDAVRAAADEMSTARNAYQAAIAGSPKLAGMSAARFLSSTPTGSFTSSDAYKAARNAATDLVKAQQKHSARKSDYDAYKSGTTPEVKSAKAALKTAKANAKKATGRTAKKAANDAVKDATKALKKAQKATGKIKVGTGDNAVELPNADVLPSDRFNALKLMKSPAAMDYSMIPRYYRSPGQTSRLGKQRGEYNTETAANSAFADNLRAFRSEPKRQTYANVPNLKPAIQSDMGNPFADTRLDTDRYFSPALTSSIKPKKKTTKRISDSVNISDIINF